MTNIIRRIRTILGKGETSIININIHPDDEVLFYIYASEMPIVVDLANDEVFVDSENSRTSMDATMLEELSKICSMLEKNLKEIKECLN